MINTEEVCHGFKYYFEEIKEDNNHFHKLNRMDRFSDRLYRVRKFVVLLGKNIKQKLDFLISIAYTLK